MSKDRIVIAMSGGVDSSVAAALLAREGREVIGVSMQLWDYTEAEESTGASGGSCCSLDDLYDARRVADRLEIPFYVLNMEELFSKEVVDYFVESYLKGETPNPCTKCNQELKFKHLLAKARTLGADRLATGHYARIEERGGSFRLLRGLDPGKDQSYFLFTMNQEELASVEFPLGGMRKDEVRAIATSEGLSVAEKSESQEICFIDGSVGGGSYGDFVAEKTGATGGDIVNTDGAVVGAHGGLFRYTIGQRKGLGIGGSGGPFYVTRIDTKNNRLVVGGKEDLSCVGLVAREMNWIAETPEPGTVLTVVIRYRHRGVRAKVFPEEGLRLRVEFIEDEKSVTPGQAVVLYNGDEVVGGGWIEGAL